MAHPHSALRVPDGPLDSLPVPPNFGPELRHPPSSADLAHLCEHAGDPEGGSLLYQFRVGDFVLTWHDTSGPVSTDAPQVLDPPAACSDCCSIPPTTSPRSG
ncbi:hypothetical protein [Nocardia sp. NPDC005745]|uniref:hypothetical protein n=1 Tax=Nocardia sp. NPDC005745 TaxID=3157061 RepID=UPI0033E2232F